MGFEKIHKCIGLTFVQKIISLSDRSLRAALLLVMTGACLQSPAPKEGMYMPTNEFDTVEMESDAGFDLDTMPTREKNECSALDSRLYQLTLAENPLINAEKLGFTINNGKVQVMFVLVSEEAGFLLDYGVEIGKQSGNRVQGFAPIDQLCGLAESETVLAIRPAAQAVLP
jgi:hypothetical protein